MSSWSTSSATLPKRSIDQDVRRPRSPSSTRGCGSSTVSSSAGSSGSPASASSAPRARWAATGAKMSRPWKVADTGSSRCGERLMSTARSTPPQRSHARLSSPLSGPTSTRPSLARSATRAALGAYLRVHHRHVHTDRHVRQRVAQHERALTHRVALDAVGDVDDRASGCDAADHAVADADELVVAAVVGEQRDDHAAPLRAARRRSRHPRARRCRAARPRRARSRPCSRRVALVTGPIDTTRAPSGRPRRVAEEAHRGAGGEGDVVGARERRVGVRERLGHRVVERDAPPPRRRARAGRRAACRGPRRRGPRAPAGPPAARRSSASSSPSATKRSGTTSASMPRSRSSRRCPGRSRRPSPRRARARRARASAAK